MMRAIAAVLALALPACANAPEASLYPEERGEAPPGICGIPGMVGETNRTIQGRINGCGLEDGVQVTQVAGVTLSQGASMDCRTARALHDWVTGSAKPTLSGRGGGLMRLEVAAGYACRTRNNRPGGRVSEHGKGRAIDISGFTLRDGTTLTVLRDWRGGDSRLLKRMHREACGPFKTVIGPDGDRYHQDHFHFDTARRRNGSSYCR